MAMPYRPPSANAPQIAAHRHHRQRGGFHRDAESGDDVGAVAGGRGLCYVLHRLVLGAGVVLGDPHDQAGQDQADQRAAIQRHRSMHVVGHQSGGDRVEGDGGQHAGNDHALVQRTHDRAAWLHLDEQRADDRSDDRHAAQYQRIQHGIGTGFGQHQAAQQHGGDDGDRIGFKEVGRHAGAVADVVTDVVGDHRRVARIVFGNAGFDLADQIGADVGALGEDAAPQPRENRDQRGAEGQADQRVQRLFHRQAHLQQQCVVAGHAQQAQPDHQHAGDRAAAEGDVHRRADAVARRLCGTHVGAYRHVHADVAGGAGQHRADCKTNRGVPAEEDADQHEQHHAGDADGQVLAVEIGTRTFLDRGGDRDHARIAGGLAQDPARRDDSEQDRENGAAQRQ